VDGKKQAFSIIMGSLVVGMTGHGHGEKEEE